MELIVFNTAKEASAYAMQHFARSLQSGVKTFGLATGSTPEHLYRYLSASELDFSDATAINLDEYYGLKASDPQSYAYFMKQHLFDAKPFKATHIPNGSATNVEDELARYDQILDSNPIDLQILGIGANAHIGFNEPGSSFTSQTRLVNLTEETIQANKRFFNSEEEVPRQALSMGIGSITQAKQILLMAFGSSKSQAIYDTVYGPITEDVPASILKNHTNTLFLMDKEAAAKLNTTDYIQM